MYKYKIHEKYINKIMTTKTMQYLKHEINLGAVSYRYV